MVQRRERPGLWSGGGGRGGGGRQSLEARRHLRAGSQAQRGARLAVRVCSPGTRDPRGTERLHVRAASAPGSGEEVEPQRTWASVRTGRPGAGPICGRGCRVPSPPGHQLVTQPPFRDPRPVPSDTEGMGFGESLEVWRRGPGGPAALTLVSFPHTRRQGSKEGGCGRCVSSRAAPVTPSSRGSAWSHASQACPHLVPLWGGTSGRLCVPHKWSPGGLPGPPDALSGPPPTPRAALFGAAFLWL